MRRGESCLSVIGFRVLCAPEGARGGLGGDDGVERKGDFTGCELIVVCWVDFFEVCHCDSCDGAEPKDDEESCGFSVNELVDAEVVHVVFRLGFSLSGNRALELP